MTEEIAAEAVDDDRVKQLEQEGDIAADYLEELLDIADLDGDLDMDVEGDRAAVSIVGADLAQLVGQHGEVLDALQELTRLAVYRETGERSRLTLTGRTRENRFGAVLLFRSRYLAPAAHSARFYREYFRPAAEHVVTKERRRWLVAYRGVEFYVHLDRLIAPAVDGYFLEIKSRTWSQRDARDKAAVISELLALFEASPDETLGEGYVELARGGGQSRL